jgi:parallel beta-helix repeat protein
MNNVAAFNGKSGMTFWSPNSTFTGAKVENNIMHGNGDAGIQMYQARGGGVIIHNNIFFSNRLGDIRNDGSSLQYSATNLIRSNPLFVSATDFRVQSGSAAINRGVNLTSQNLTIDRLGVRRPQGGVFDLGAYERVP